MKFFYRIGKEYGVDPIRILEKATVYYYHGAPNEALEHLLEEAEEKSLVLELSQNEKVIQVKRVDPTGRITIGFDIEEKLKMDFITQLKKINNLDTLTFKLDHEQLLMSFEKQLKEVQERYDKVFPNA